MGLSPGLLGGGARIVKPTLAMAVATASGVQAQSSGGGFRRSHPASRVKDALAWYHSEEYRPALEIRKRSSSSRLLIFGE